MRALIVGGGIAGLSTALGLRQRGWTVEVWEQAAALSAVGAGLQISPNGSRVLAQLGILERVQAAAFAPEALEMRVGRSGRRVFRAQLEAAGAPCFGAPYLHVHRADLIDALAGACDEHDIPVATGRQLSGFKQLDAAVIARAADGHSHRSELLLGADGIHSAVRRQLFGDQPARFTGNLAWRATVPLDRLGQDAPPPTACVWTGHRRHAVTYRLRGGREANFVGVVETARWREESWVAPGRRAEALADFAGWDPTVTRLIEQADNHHKWALFDRPPLPTWAQGRVALLGDACHPMLPFQAQGACQALEDAWALARLLPQGTGADPRPALRRYTALRQPRASRVQASARANQRRFHLPGPAYLPLQLAAWLWPNWPLRMQRWLYSYDIVAAAERVEFAT